MRIRGDSAPTEGQSLALPPQTLETNDGLHGCIPVHLPHGDQSVALITDPLIAVQSLLIHLATGLLGDEGVGLVGGIPLGLGVPNVLRCLTEVMSP